GNDLIKELGNRTTGKWEINFYTFIPEGKQGYFGFFSNFSPDTLEWAFECFLNENGTADLHAGSFLSFDYSQNVWNSFHVVVDLNIDSVEFWFNNDLIKEWRWTLGANGLGCDLKLAATEFYGIIANTSMMFVDNYWFDGNPTSVELDINRNIDFVLQQNFPNPFNPSTKIKYTISSVTLSGVEVSLVILKVFDVLGKEVATLVNEEKPSGTYDVEFNGSNLPSGIYFYQLKAGEYSNTKKMILLK
ncbi:MAG: T9SS type A sorting domain-containing protein, partial [Ignavibacteriaceae bacterium]